MARIAVGNRAYHQLDGPQCLVNAALIGQVPILRFRMSGKPTMQPRCAPSWINSPRARADRNFRRKAPYLGRGLQVS